jgi:uncharacterized membrane protein YphA (DoxX/SURF4 family)
VGNNADRRLVEKREEVRRERVPAWVVVARLLLGIVFLTSGMAKLVPGFPSVIGPTWLVKSLEPHGLALFARFIALAEVLAGSLLLTKRLATLGALLLLPIVTCILVIVVSLRWQGTPYVAVILLLLNLALLAYDASKLKYIVVDGRRDPAK